MANAAVAFRAPYGADGQCNIQISNCDFHSGTDDPNGYIYKMMEEVEADYQKTVSTSDTYDSEYTCQYQYYKILRDQYNLTFDEILHGIAMPHKKAFLCGDREDYYEYNLNLNLGISGCTFKNIESRIPKVRGGFCYMYNSIIDNRDYYTYRQILIDKGVKGIAAAYPRPNDNKNPYYFKCAMVSECFIFGVGASICSNNNIIMGVDSLIKNNDKASDFGSDKVRDMTNAETCGGYNYTNTYFTNNFDLDTEFTSTPNGIPLSPDNDPAFVVNPKYFSWHTEDGEEPFEPVLYKRTELAQKVYDNAGVSAAIGDRFLFTEQE
jgi:pectate lyase